MAQDPVLEGSYVRLEPLTRGHIEGLLGAAGTEVELFKWTTVPQTLSGMTQYVESALKGHADGTTLAFATVRRSDNLVLGSTRFFLIERWPWPAGHARVTSSRADGCEIGYTWLSPVAIRTPTNTEAKLLMLTHAFEVWNVERVCFHTDARNERSRNALLRGGAKFEGILRAHRLSADLKPRESARYSVIASEWPQVRELLRGKLLERQ
jgi:RimJ/RimL family protein N-acetyltransferase